MTQTVTKSRGLLVCLFASLFACMFQIVAVMLSCVVGTLSHFSDQEQPLCAQGWAGAAFHHPGRQRSQTEPTPA